MNRCALYAVKLSKTDFIVIKIKLFLSKLAAIGFPPDLFTFTLHKGLQAFAQLD